MTYDPWTLQSLPSGDSHLHYLRLLNPQNQMIMTAIQLDLFAQEPLTAAAPSTGLHHSDINLRDTDGNVCARVTIENTMTLIPCPSCPLHEVCASDECGMKLFDIDDAEENYYPFTDWLSDPL